MSNARTCHYVVSVTRVVDTGARVDDPTRPDFVHNVLTQRQAAILFRSLLVGVEGAYDDGENPDADPVEALGLALEQLVAAGAGLLPAEVDQ